MTIGRRGDERLVAVRDDGAGFEPPEDAAAQGLKNMRQRAAAIGGAFSLGRRRDAAPRSRSCCGRTALRQGCGKPAIEIGTVTDAHPPFRVDA